MWWSLKYRKHSQPGLTIFLTAAATCAGMAQTPDRLESGGQAEVALQGYYLGSNSQSLVDTSGIAFKFQHFMPKFGLLSGSFEGYGQNQSIQAGDNYLELRGIPFGGMRWTVRGGDFRISTNMVEFPFYNIFNPEITPRGVQLRATRGESQITFFIGTETVLAGPRLPFRISTGQKTTGISIQQKVGSRLQLGVRLLRLTNGANPEGDSLFLYQQKFAFRRVNSATAQVLYNLTKRLRLYSEVSFASALEADPLAVAQRGSLSSLVGAAYESPMLTIRANYMSQTRTYLPLAGYFAGDRRGPYGEARFRPFRRLEVFGSASRYSNNLSLDQALPTLTSNSFSAGTSLSLPWKTTLNGQVSDISLLSRISGEDLRQTMKNRQTQVSLSRPVRNHSLRFSFRDMNFTGAQIRDRQKSAEVEDIFRVKRFAFGGAARLQRSDGLERRNTMFYRGSAQASFSRFTAHAYLEFGNDLVNRTVFATNMFSTNVVGVTARLGRGWNLTMDMVRNRLLSELNQENIFLFENRGLGLTSILSDFNQWSVFFRLTKDFRWGAPLNHGEGGSFSTRATDVPLVGAIEGFVYNKTLSGSSAVSGVAVKLDNSRTVTTDQNGKFRFVEVPEGNHLVALAIEKLPAEYDPGHRREVSVRVLPAKAARAELDVASLTSLSGVVTSPTGISAQDIAVRLLPIGRFTSTQEDGNFVFYNVPEGEYEIEVVRETLPEETALTSTSRAAVSVRLGRALATVTFGIFSTRREKPTRQVFEQVIVAKMPVRVEKPIVSVRSPHPEVEPTLPMIERIVPVVTARPTSPPNHTSVETYVQVAAVTPGEVPAFLARLRREGVSCITEPVPGRPLVRILVGPLGDQATLDRSKTKLSSLGFVQVFVRLGASISRAAAVLVTPQRRPDPPPMQPPAAGGRHLQVAAIIPSEAAGLAARLANEGLPTWLEPVPSKGLVRVMVGPFPDKASILKAKAKLEGLHFSPFAR